MNSDGCRFHLMIVPCFTEPSFVLALPSSWYNGSTVEEESSSSNLKCDNIFSPPDEVLKVSYCDGSMSVVSFVVPRVVNSYCSNTTGSVSVKCYRNVRLPRWLSTTSMSKMAARAKKKNLFWAASESKGQLTGNFIGRIGATCSSKTPKIIPNRNPGWPPWWPSW